jgi:hypothetical protein
MRLFFMGPRFFGLRPGISFGPSDFRKAARAISGAQTSNMTGGFVYVLADESGRHKIGSARDPIDRRATLQTGSPERLSFAFIGVAPEMTYVQIERAAHDLLERQKIPNGGSEWFRVPSSIAIGAVYEAAQRLGYPIQQVTPEMVPQIVSLASQPDQTAPKRVPGFLKWTLGVLLFVLAVLIALAAIGSSQPPA